MDWEQCDDGVLQYILHTRGVKLCFRTTRHQLLTLAQESNASKKNKYDEQYELTKARIKKFSVDSEKYKARKDRANDRVDFIEKQLTRVSSSAPQVQSRFAEEKKNIVLIFEMRRVALLEEKQNQLEELESRHKSDIESEKQKLDTLEAARSKARTEAKYLQLAEPCDNSIQTVWLMETYLKLDFIVVSSNYIL